MCDRSYPVIREALSAVPRWLDRLDATMTLECGSCFGEGGFRLYPSEHSHRTVWEVCRDCEGEGRVPL
jgi:hypothetical protein